MKTHNQCLIIWSAVGYAKGYCICRDFMPAILATSDGWLWTAKVKEGLYQWTRLSFNKNARNVLNWLPDEFKGLRAIQPIRGEDVTWRRVIKAAGSRYFLVGDAATVLDPASSHGILRALMSGIKAANAIFYIVKRQCPVGIAIKDYNIWISNWFFHDLEKLKNIYLCHPYPPIWLV